MLPGDNLIYCCPVKLKIAQDLSPNSFIIKGSDFFMIKASPPNQKVLVLVVLFEHLLQ